MTSSLLRFDLAERRRIAAGALAPLAAALRLELEPLIAGALPIPERKARLTRVGGRCAFDGTLLRFDPFKPEDHECPQCHRVFVGEAHHDWWAMGAQLWTAERAVQAAALNLLTDDAAAGSLAVRILTELSVRYTSWPNRDNALGPTRPFFSTYLESIWLLNLCHAVALLEASVQDARTGKALSAVRDLLIAPSRTLIAGFNEGLSNRQVWNEAAILAASHILGDNATIAKRLDANGGIRDLLAHGLLSDGTWYEGENYHLFAHRGLWYGVEFMRAANHDIDARLLSRFREGYITPFLGLLPDGTLPSRRDSQYRVSIHQWRFAEWCELGLAHNIERTPTRTRLSGLLHDLYESTPHDAANSDGGHHRFSTADSERNEPAGRLSRSSLSWRALLMAHEQMPEKGEWHPDSVCLPGQGLAVLRRDAGRTYVALEGGHTGGGHGHPDRLSLTLQRGHTRWLEDPGTGSYVERTLHWYRSTLAHFAPLFDGASQRRVPAELLAFEERGGAGWISKRVADVAPRVVATRTVVVADGYLVDLLEWTGARDHQIDLPLARNAEVVGLHAWNAADPRGAGGLEDGFDFLTDAECSFAGSRVTGSPSIELSLAGETTARAHYVATGKVTLWRADAPGSPGQPRRPIHWLRTRGMSGVVIGVWSWNDSVSTVNLDVNASPPVIEVDTAEGTTAQHSRTEGGWHIALRARHATSSIDLSGLPVPVSPPRVTAELPGDVPDDTQRAVGAAARDEHVAGQIPPLPTLTLPRLAAAPAIVSEKAGHSVPGARRFHLGESHYVRTEQSWTEAGQPAAIVQIGVTKDALIVDVLSRTGPVTVPGLNEDNVLDNERRDVNSDGVQVHIGLPDGDGWKGGWLIVPAPESRPHARVTPLFPGSGLIDTAWALTNDGWALRLAIPLSEIAVHSTRELLLEIVVNERPAERQRRRGQLVLSGGGGFGYLRGDRSEFGKALRFRLPESDDAGVTPGVYL